MEKTPLLNSMNSTETYMKFNRSTLAALDHCSAVVASKFVAPKCTIAARRTESQKTLLGFLFRRQTVWSKL